MHGTFVTYREFTAALTTVARLRSATTMTAGAHIPGAWEEALRLAGVSKRELASLTQPRILHVEEKRFGIDGRVCGYMLPTLTSRVPSPYEVRGLIIIYATSDEKELLRNAAVHEYLHYIWYVRALRDSSFVIHNPDGEAWVKTLIPAECPVD